MAAETPTRDAVFCAAVEIASPEDRAAYIAQACGGDGELRAQVEKLVDAHFRAGSFLEAPALGGTGPFIPASSQEIATGPAEGPGAVVGPYKLLQQIGEGGMGAVFMAEQTQPVQRKVALKIIKPGMDSRQVIARFEAERQALALMDHPNIARVFDGGATEAGRPFFVMELVKGVPITKYCDAHKLTPKQRLELFIPVCQAVQHAHQKGIIHRDLKPSNVLVALYDGKPVPKVIDFGVAKATGQKLTERTLFTEFGSVVGTLEYMSPEQAELNQLDIDTRSDVYSLGVVLYELLTGSTPLERKRLRDAGLLVALRIIREEEPQRPSVRLSTTEELPAIAAQRGLEPKKLSGVVRGDLDWIVMKALEKDRNRRYETATGLARDIGRCLADEPVAACPPSSWYRMRKFARRNRARLTVAACLLLGATAVGGSAGWAVWDRGQREAKIEREEGARRAEAESRVRESLNAARALNAENKPAAARQKLAEAQSQLGQDRTALSGLAAEIDALEADLNRLEQFQALIDRAYEAETTSTPELALEADSVVAGSGDHATTGATTRGDHATTGRRPLGPNYWERQPARAVPFLLQALA
ncbi:MAG TPA: protein kinase, partial [Gemmataceae bacterium]|nr:protein kinase [Gemmataceae bacterium]